MRERAVKECVRGGGEAQGSEGACVKKCGEGM